MTGRGLVTMLSVIQTSQMYKRLDHTSFMSGENVFRVSLYDNTKVLVYKAFLHVTGNCGI